MNTIQLQHDTAEGYRRAWPRRLWWPRGDEMTAYLIVEIADVRDEKAYAEYRARVSPGLAPREDAISRAVGG